MRNVILHYHLFKNAGTSIDTNLQASFGEQWENYDHHLGHTISAEDIRNKLEAQPTLKALSSHDAAPPLPEGRFRLFPIVVLRHPILRSKSAYTFECGKQLGLPAPKISFADYIKERVRKDLNGGVITNFQCCRLANQSPKGPDSRTPEDERDYFNRAKEFISSLPVFGLVEQFDISMQLFHSFLSPYFPELKWQTQWKNATNQDTGSIDEKIEAIARQLGPELFQHLQQRNQLDLQLYHYACEQFKHLQNQRTKHS